MKSQVGVGPERLLSQLVHAEKRGEAFGYNAIDFGAPQAEEAIQGSNVELAWP